MYFVNSFILNELKLNNYYKSSKHNVRTLVLYSGGRKFKSSADRIIYFLFLQSKKIVFQEPVRALSFKILF
jgi:hypothetical protein